MQPARLSASLPYTLAPAAQDRLALGLFLDQTRPFGVFLFMKSRFSIPEPSLHEGVSRPSVRIRSREWPLHGRSWFLVSDCVEDVRGVVDGLSQFVYIFDEMKFSH